MRKKVYKLSKDAIKFLESIKIENKNSIFLQSLKINVNYIFQIEKVQKTKNYIYNSTLLDNNSKSSRFILILDNQEDIPKKGDLINIKEIEKCYNEDYKLFIYKCSCITFIEKELNFLVDISKIKNYDIKIKNEINENGKEKNKIITYDIKNINNFKENGEEDEKEEEENEEEEEEEENGENGNIKNNNIIKKEKYNNEINNINKYKYKEFQNNNDNNIINYNKINLNENENEKEYNINNDIQNSNNFLSISNLNLNSKYFNIILKCVKKEEIKSSKFKKNKKYQNYLFIDINGDKIEGISFDYDTKNFDNIIRVNEIYKINNSNIILNNNHYGNLDIPFKLLLNKNVQLINISNIKEIGNKFNNSYNNLNIQKLPNNYNFVSIKNILYIKKNEIINVSTFVLKDNGNITLYDKYNNEFIGRSLILGDNSNYRINLTIWHPKDLKKIYSPGDLLYIQNCKVNEYNNLKILYSTKDQKIFNSFNLEFDEKLKKYYSEHKDLNEYFEIKIKPEKDFLENIKYNPTYVELIFIRDIQEIFKTNINKILNFKISATVKKINHSYNNYYYGCENCKKKMNKNICENCGSKNKKIILHFSINVIDATSSLWLLLFGEKAESFLGVKGEEYKNILEKGLSRENDELNKLNSKIKDKEFIFLGKTQYYSYNESKGYRFHVNYFSKKSKRHYISLTKYLKNLLKL